MRRTLFIMLAAVLALSGVAGAGAWLAGRYRDAMHRASDAEALAASLRSQLNSADKGVVEVTRYVDRVHTVRVKGDTIIKEVPRYVSVQADAACTVPVGFVRLHDAAAAGTVLDQDSGDPDATASGIPLSAVAGTVVHNYTTGHVNAERLRALQATLRAQGVTIIGDPAP